MNTSDNKTNRISEADVESLLTSFFSEEMPLEFRLDPTPTISDAGTSSTRTVWAVMATTAAALMFALIVFQSTADHSINGSENSFANTPLIPTDTATPVTDRIETEEGTVEMKTWLTKEQDTESGMDLTGIHFELYEIEVEPDDDEADRDEEHNDPADGAPQSKTPKSDVAD